MIPHFEPESMSSYTVLSYEYENIINGISVIAKSLNCRFFLTGTKLLSKTFIHKGTLYRATDNVSPGVQDKTYGLDLLGNVNAIRDNLDADRNLDFDYDDLYRLTDAYGIYGSINYTMDDTGNRLSRTADGMTETYGYLSGTSTLDRVIGSDALNIAIDAAGNTTTHGNRIFTYDQNNRLTGVQEDGVTLASYVTSADGRRIKKTVDGNTTVFHYNLQGRLIAESDGQGNPTKLYFYLNGEPLAMVVSQTGDLDGDHDVDGSDLALFLADYGPGCTGSACDSDFNGDGGVDIEDLKIIAAALGHTATGVYYYHNDRLGTPQRMTDATGNIAWAADYLPFEMWISPLKRLRTACGLLANITMWKQGCTITTIGIMIRALGGI